VKTVQNQRTKLRGDGLIRSVADRRASGESGKKRVRRAHECTDPGTRAGVHGARRPHRFQIDAWRARRGYEPRRARHRAGTSW